MTEEKEEKVKEGDKVLTDEEKGGRRRRRA